MADMFFGYMRPDGKVGSRNYVAVVPSVVCANEVAEAISNQVMNCRPLLHHQGCCQLPPDLERVTDTLISLACHPNAGAVIVIGLGCERFDPQELYDAVKATGKPVAKFVIQEEGGVTNTLRLNFSNANEDSIVEGIRRLGQVLREQL